MEGIHRMVCWLVQAVENAHRTTCLDGRGHNGVGEQSVVHGLAA